jgi:Flp pilus assembly protein TadD
MFTVVLFAAFLTLLWEQHQTGHARLWLLPLLMVAWVNLHLGFVAGMALMAGYVLLELLDMPWPERREAATRQLKCAWPWLAATCAATLVNPWGWQIYQAVIRQQSAMASHSQLIVEWGSVRLTWEKVSTALSWRHPDFSVVMLLVIALAIPVALARRQLGAMTLLCIAALLGVRYVRFHALLSLVGVVIAGSVLTSALDLCRTVVKDARHRSFLALGGCCVLGLLTCIWSADLISNQTYLRGTTTSFGAGLSWRFPERAAAFIERENIPGQIFNSYNEGGYLAWRLGPKYLDYIDGRAIPFGPELLERNMKLMRTAPDSSEWRQECERYNINAILVSLTTRYQALDAFPTLKQFCAGDTWKPVYIDEVSAVFLRRGPGTERLVTQLQIDCNTVPLPVVVPSGNKSNAFNSWANAAAVLKALGRNAEALAATARALAIFPDSAYVHIIRGDILLEMGNVGDAEKDYWAAVALDPDSASWARLAQMYEKQRRWNDAIHAWEYVAKLAAHPYTALLSLGYDYLYAHDPDGALKAFDRAQAAQPQPIIDIAEPQVLAANLAHGRAVAWSALGQFDRAVLFEEEVVRLTPTKSANWLILSTIYEHLGRMEDAQRARERAATASFR